MSDIKEIKCSCCRCHDDFDGCTAWDCDIDFEVSIQKVKDTAKAYGISVTAITAILAVDEERRLTEKARKEKTGDGILPEDFDPRYDSNFLITFENVPDLGKKMLIDMRPEDLKRLRAEIDAVLKIQEGEDV